MAATLAVIGTGLIGTSFALALKRAGYPGSLIACDADSSRAERAVQRGAFDAVAASPAAAAGAAGVLVVAVPVAAMRAVFASLGTLENGVVLTDAGSVKGCVIDDALAVFGALPAGLVPAHPVAGTENSGPDAAEAGLFHGCRVVLTPPADAAPVAVAQVSALWRLAGAAEIISMKPSLHDRIFSRTSHLPHAVAYALMHSLAAHAAIGDLRTYSAGGLRDFTRIAASDPAMWRDILLANAGPVLEALENFSDSLDELRDAVAHGDGETLYALFERIAVQRRELDAD